MNHEILSLKGLYQFLLVKDYPIFSNGIISKSNKAGLTLTKFWQGNILVDFRNGKYGRMVWRVEGGRNRYISEFCNRSSRISFYNEYACEWSGFITQEVILRQCNQFAGFLVERNYDYDVFIQKSEAYIKLLAVNDNAFSQGAETFFEEALEERRYFEDFGVRGQALFCGWMLTFFMLHAMAGNGEGEAFLRQLRKNQDISVRSVGKLLGRVENISKQEVTFLTTKNSEICREPLDSRHFFGREEELFELQDMLKLGGKYLVSGIGGIGKTELMRQLLHCTVEEGLADCVCVIQYEGNMADSLIRAFGQTHNGEKEIKVQEALAIVRMHADERVAIFVDNVSHSMEEDEDIQQLLQLPATVFMTSRYQTMNGFETYVVKPISKKAGALIFRDNYALPINITDKQLLNNLLEKDIWCHTLTLRLLGKAAKAKNWTLQEMLDQVDAEGKMLGLDRQNGYENLKQLYRQIYTVSGLEERMNRFLRVFALLPYDSYSMEFIRTYLSDFLGKDVAVERSVEQLWESGWLEKRESGYSMHPFVVECILVKEVLVEEVSPFFDRVIETLKGETGDFFLDMINVTNGQNDAEFLLRAKSTILLPVGVMAKQLTGILKECYFQLVLLSFYAEMECVGVSKSLDERLVNMWRQAKAYSEVTYAGAIIGLHMGGYNDWEQMEIEYDRVMSMSLPDKLMDVYKMSLGNKLTNPGDFKFREKVGRDNWSEKNSIPVRINGAQLLSMICLERGDLAKTVTLQQEGMELGKNTIYENCQARLVLGINLANNYCALGLFDEAEELIKASSESVEEGLVMKWLRLMVMGTLKRNKGAEGLGIAEFEEAIRIAEVIFADTFRHNYFKSASDLAMAYHKAGRYEEAGLYYRKVLQSMETFGCDHFSNSRILNNLGVLYLDWGKYEDALEYFISAYEMGKEMGGLPQAEPANNLSKIYGKLGDREKELQYIEEALPVLEHFYGSEHPKVVDAKHRKIGEAKDIGEGESK